MPSVAQTIPLDLLLAFQFFHPFLFAKATTPKPSILRPGTKQAKLIEMLRTDEGATIAEIVAVTGWMAHTARGVISGVLKKKLGLAITATKVEGRGSVYRIC